MKLGMAKQDDWIRVTVRFPPELHERLNEARGARSFNAEVVSRLETSFEVDLARFQRDREELSALLNRHSQMEATMKSLIALLEEANERLARKEAE